MRKVFQASVTILLSLSLSKPVLAADYSYVVGGQIRCLGKTNHHVIMGQTYNHGAAVLFSVYERAKSDVGSWMETSRVAEVTEDQSYDPIVYIFPTKNFADTEIELKSAEPLISDVREHTVNEFCSRPSPN